jgi:RNA polymerase sigma-70 factor, ECF subfamily
MFFGAVTFDPKRSYRVWFARVDTFWQDRESHFIQKPISRSSSLLKGAPVAAPNPGFRFQPPNEDWAGWVRDAANGDQSALAKLYDSTNRMVYGLILRIVSNNHTAEEVLLDVYLQIWRKAETYSSSKGTVLAWLFTIARSRAIDVLRSRASKESGQQEPLDTAATAVDRSPSPEENSAIAQRRQYVQQCLAELPAEQRETIELAYFRGLSHSEIAETLRQPLGTVKTRVRLGMARLRESLRRYEDQL